MTVGDPMPPMQLIHIRLPGSVRNRLLLLSKKTGAPVTELVRRAIKLYLAQQEQEQESESPPSY